MSASTDRISLEKGHRVMSHLVPLLRAGSERVAAVGSYIRRRETLGDIELLAVPRTLQVTGDLQVAGQGNLFAGEALQVNGVWLVLNRLVLEDRARPVRPAAPVDPATGEIPLDETWDHRRQPNKARKLRLWLPRCRVLVEVWMCPAEEWGVQETFRTGPAEFSHALAGHAKRIGRPIRRGRVWMHGEAVPTPEPEDVFTTLGLRWVPRPLRRDGRDLRREFG